MKDILVALDSTDTCKIRIEAALNLAERFDSHVTGFYQQRNIDYALYGKAYTGVVIDTLQDWVEKESNAVKEIFNNCIKSNTAKCTLKIVEPHPHNAIFDQASLSDLVVSGQLNPGKHTHVDHNQPEHLVMGSGKPVLTVPYIGFPDSLGKNVMVAWDQSREASRAIHDAMPILKKADSVHVISIVNKEESEREIVAADLAEHLARHDINIETHPTVHTDVPVAETLLSRATDFGVDLIVMGAYGHSRLREYTLGGATKTILKSMTIPVLMAH